MGLIRIILIFIIIYFAIKLIFQYILFPLVKGYFTTGSGNNSYQYTRNNKEGNVTINNSNNKKKKMVNKDEGDYVDYEEVKN